MMRRLFLGRKGQSITEYAILVGIVIGALIAMQTYVKQTLSAKIKLAADGIHDGKTYLYQPKTSTSVKTVVKRDGTKTITADAIDLDIGIIGAGSDVLEDVTEVRFQEMQLEAAGE